MTPEAAKVAAMLIKAFPGSRFYRPLPDLEKVGRTAPCTRCGLPCSWEDAIERPWHVRCAEKASS